MATFTTRTASATPTLDSTKHVNYTYGMVLGADDFSQEFAYHSGRDRWMTRDIDGYGTLSGLRVTAERRGAETEVIVTAGTAATPSGQLVCVPVAQCANLNRWLAVARNREGAVARVGDPPAADLTLYVVLCFRDCPTDKLPVPGEPCRSEEDTMADSRLKDDFLLELRFDPPAQVEEDALRDFVLWLARHVEFTDAPGEFATPEGFLAALRAAAEGYSSPPASPADYMYDSPPLLLRVRTQDRAEYLRAAFLLWATELRPRWRPAHIARPCACREEAHASEHEGHEDEDCVLLAELRVPLTPAFQVNEVQGVEVDETRRPLLVHQRMLQEWLLAGEHATAAAATAVTLPLVTVERVVPNTGSFRFWFHLDATDGSATVTSFNAGMVAALRENDAGPNFLVPVVAPVAAVAGRRNLFNVNLASNPDTVRFRLDISTIQVAHGGVTSSLAEYARRNNIRFVGQGADGTVTAFPPLRIA
jgi:hypothetical protein